MEIKPNELAKELYLKGFDIEKIASILNKSVRTIQNYKSNGGDWDTLKASIYIDNNQNDKQKLYQNFTDQMYIAIKEINDSDMEPIKKASAIAQLGDSFVKMSKVAGYEDPKSYGLSIIKKAITYIINELKEPNTQNCIHKIVELLERDDFVQKLGNIDVY